MHIGGEIPGVGAELALAPVAALTPPAAREPDTGNDAVERQQEVRVLPLKRDREIDRRERQLLTDIVQAGFRLATDERMDALDELQREWKHLSQQAQTSADSPDRRFARRVLGTLTASIRTDDADYQKIIAQYRLPRR